MTFLLEQDEAVGFKIEPEKASIVIGPHSEGEQKFKASVSKKAASGVSLLAVNVKFDGWDLQKWCETIIEISR